MQIQSIAQQLLAPLTLDRNSASSADVTTPSQSVDSSSGDLAVGGSRAFHEIISQYDVTNITPREFTAMIQQLHDAGEINDTEFRDLSRMRLELEQAGAPPEQPLNLVDFFEKKLRDKQSDFQLMQQASLPEDARTLKGDAFTSEAKKQLDWVRKFALVHASGADGVDLGA